MFLSRTNESVIELQSCMGSALSERVGLQEVGGFISKGKVGQVYPTGEGGWVSHTGKGRCSQGKLSFP